MSSIINWMVQDNAFSPDAHVSPSHSAIDDIHEAGGRLGWLGLARGGQVCEMGRRKNEVSPSCQMVKS